MKQVVDVYKKLQASRKTGPASETPTASTSSASPVNVSARDNAAAEDLKSKGNSLMAAKDYNGAIASYSDAIAKDGTNAVFYSNRCVLILLPYLYTD